MNEPTSVDDNTNNNNKLTSTGDHNPDPVSNYINTVNEDKQTSSSSSFLIDTIENNYSSTNTNPTQAGTLTVYPHYLNISQHKSFQLSCIYNGFHFSDVRLIWFKNEKHIDHTNQRRFLLHHYKQFNTSVSILKFSHGLPSDSGIYRCVAAADTQHWSLNQTSYLVINKSNFINITPFYTVYSLHN